ncbi:unnamed protein product [Nezara viridula]|uniref:Uncharacterized protein n=1 Tax=Nezara viridula TaxID=85310 RepID=A0A9P0MWW8_NEZVI|nr:unnamed protein product [Nezara viridula]
MAYTDDITIYSSSKNATNTLEQAEQLCNIIRNELMKYKGQYQTWVKYRFLTKESMFGMG